MSSSYITTCATLIILLLLMTHALGINNLSDVLETVWEARSKWYNIGLKLGTSSGTLDSISSKGRDDPDLCITPMIKDWLNNGNPQPTWAAVAKALKSPMVGYGHLAEQLPVWTYCRFLFIVLCKILYIIHCGIVCVYFAFFDRNENVYPIQSYIKSEDISSKWFFSSLE